MIEIAVMALTIASVSGWCLYADERDKRNGDKRVFERFRRKEAESRRALCKKVFDTAYRQGRQSERTKQSFDTFTIEKHENEVKRKRLPARSEKA